MSVVGSVAESSEKSMASDIGVMEKSLQTVNTPKLALASCGFEFSRGKNLSSRSISHRQICKQDCKTVRRSRWEQGNAG